MSNLSLFSAVGIEIEYMLVDKELLNIQPKTDVLLHALSGENINEAVLGNIMLSNELVKHVVEFKNNGPKGLDEPIAEHFQEAIHAIQPLLAQHHLSLMPSAAHPWMNPHLETYLWDNGNNKIYQQYNKIFNCKGHGWSNLQSMHVNLPYANDEEFKLLHNAIRLILPLLPALAASSPILDGKFTGLLDSRLYYYEQNQQRIRSISGDIIPPFIGSEEEYQQHILTPMYQEIRPFDKEGLLQEPWLNSRGCIPKFDLKAIEIRIVDTQECVNADIAIAKAISAILKKWCDTSDYFLAHPASIMPLKHAYDAAIKSGLNTAIADGSLFLQWQVPKRLKTMRAVWAFLIEEISTSLNNQEQKALEYILSQGNLSERILNLTGPNPDKSTLKRVYSYLPTCLLTNEQL